MNLQEATIKALTNNKSSLTEKAHIREFIVKKLIKDKLTYDRDIDKANQLLQAYDHFHSISGLVTIPGDLTKLAENGMQDCYYYLSNILGTDKLD